MQIYDGLILTPAMSFHPVNAFEEGEKIVLYVSVNLKPLALVLTITLKLGGYGVGQLI